MLSVILYGRNDAHGYNLHKRAALSLNAIAHVLTDPDDEIIFVDYNTPEELPTFLETIADTLTEEARRRIRVIRVRTSYHAQFSGKTTLAALEPQSRNIAVRRANARNRWILSTNTDMIFVPERAQDSLSSVCGALPDGYYHLPRFEVPEGFWERASRLDPVGAITAMRKYGRRYHLEEIVYGGFDNIYEGPGDFQLFLRDDLIAIGGFDERMILGWHVDTNIARRMRLLRGKVETAFPALRGYHCGHTRQATSLHSARRTENSLTTYAREVTSPFWTEDPMGWGMPDETFEEFQLIEDRAPQYFAALERAVPIAAADFTEAVYNEHTYCEQGFVASHVMPHLADVIFNARSGQSVFVVASDREFIECFGRFASGAPLYLSITLCADGASPGPGGEGLMGQFPSTPVDRGLAEADIVLLQYPNPRTVDQTMRGDLEWFVQHTLERFIAIERRRAYTERRRVIVVNGTHNLLQDTVNEHLDAAAMPYSSRLRHGRVADSMDLLHPVITANSSDYAVCTSLGRTRGFSPNERVVLGRALERAANWERLALEVTAMAENESRRANGEPSRGETAELARAKIKEAAARAIAQPIAVEPRVGHANRLCSGSDWEDNAWLDLAIRYFGERIYGVQERSRWVWERISLLHELLLRVPPKERPWVLLVSEGPDVLAALLSHQGYKVAYASASHLLGGAESDWSRQLHLGGLVLPTSLTPLSMAPDGVQFEAVVAASACLFNRGEEDAAALVRRLSRLVATSAHLGASTLVHVNNGKGGGALAYEEFTGALAKGGVVGRHGLRADAPIDARIPLDTVVKFAYQDDQADGIPGLSFGFDKSAQVTVGQLWARFPERLVEPTQPSASPAEAQIHAVPARAFTANVDEVDTGFAAAMHERVIIYPSVFAHMRRNLMPFLLTDSCLDRSPIRVVLADESGVVRCAIPIGPFAPAIHIDLALSPQLPVNRVRADLVRGDGVACAGRVAPCGGNLRLTFPASTDSSLVTLVIEAQSVEISVLTAWLESIDAASLAVQ